MIVANEPIPFQGTQEEKERNYKSHHWMNCDHEFACLHCDSKEWHRSAQYPCGVEPGRQITVHYGGVQYILVPEHAQIPAEWPAAVIEAIADNQANSFSA